jgi:hypothetical protein
MDGQERERNLDENNRKQKVNQHRRESLSCARRSLPFSFVTIPLTEKFFLHTKRGHSVLFHPPVMRLPPFLD